MERRNFIKTTALLSGLLTTRPSILLGEARQSPIKLPFDFLLEYVKNCLVKNEIDGSLEDLEGDGLEENEKGACGYSFKDFEKTLEDGIVVLGRDISTGIVYDAERISTRACLKSTLIYKPINAEKYCCTPYIQVMPITEHEMSKKRIGTMVVMLVGVYETCDETEDKQFTLGKQDKWGLISYGLFYELPEPISVVKINEKADLSSIIFKGTGLTEHVGEFKGINLTESHQEFYELIKRTSLCNPK